MPTEVKPKQTALLWAGRVATGIVVLFMLFDGLTKLADIGPVQQATEQLGFPTSLDRLIGVIGLASAALYVLPRTSVIGAILLTGLFGGAIASHLRLFDPLFSHTLFGLYMGLLAWAGLWLRDERLRGLIPFRRA